MNRCTQEFCPLKKFAYSCKKKLDGAKLLEWAFLAFTCIRDQNIQFIQKFQLFYPAFPRLFALLVVHCCLYPSWYLYILYLCKVWSKVKRYKDLYLKILIYKVSCSREMTSDQLFVILVEIFVVPLNKWENNLCSVWFCHFTLWTWLLKFAHFCPL